MQCITDAVQTEKKAGPNFSKKTFAIEEISIKHLSVLYPHEMNPIEMLLNFPQNWH